MDNRSRLTATTNKDAQPCYSSRPVINVNVDVDNLYVYEGEYELSAGVSYDILYSEALPAMLSLFERFGVKATFFLIGQDLELESCRRFCMEASTLGHEIANQTFTHPEFLHRLSFVEKESEILRCHEAIADLIGIAPVGFRSPGYYLDKDILNVLLANGYVYDSSVLPTPFMFLMSLYIRLKTGRVPNKAFGRKRWTIASRHPTIFFDPESNQRYLYELPIATLPFLRFPLHTTFVFMFGARYLELANSVLNDASSFVYLFHAIDTFPDLFADSKLRRDIVPLRKSLNERLTILERILGWLAGSGQPFGTNKAFLATIGCRKVSKSNILESLYYWR